MTGFNALSNTAIQAKEISNFLNQKHEKHIF